MIWQKGKGMGKGPIILITYHPTKFIIGLGFGKYEYFELWFSFLFISFNFEFKKIKDDTKIIDFLKITDWGPFD